MDQTPATTRGEAFRLGVDALKNAGIENPALDSAILLGHATGIPTDNVLMERHLTLSPGQGEIYYNLIRMRCRRTPVSRLLGEKEFFSRSFYITADVLDPRPETEILVEQAVSFLKNAKGCPSVLDVGAGSGAIAVTLAAQIPDARILATDISMKALAVARRNAVRHGVSDRMHLIQADLLGSIRGGGSFSLILSNPPYISLSQIDALPKEVRDSDPELSLLAGPEGTEFYPRIAAQAVGLLTAGGSLMVEVGVGQASLVAEFFNKAGLKDVRVINDLAGNCRVVRGIKENA